MGAARSMHLLRTVDSAATSRIDSNELLRLRLMALDAAANAVVITDCDGVMVSVNPAFTRLTGFSAD
jgi:PAS domain-containing protein